MASHNALIVELWGMLLTSATSCTVILLGIGSRTKVVNLLQNVVADEDHVSEPITLTKSQYQKLVGLLNS